MSNISYPNVLRDNRNGDEFSRIFKEAAEYIYNTESLNVLGEGVKDVYTDSVAFETYVNKLTEEVDPASIDTLKDILNNNRVEVLRESSMMGIPPITSLNAPIIVRLWAKLALKNAIPTQVVNKPVFSVAFNLPYIIEGGDPDRIRHYLPEALRADHENTELGNSKPLPVNGVKIAIATAKEFNLMGENGDLQAGRAQFQAGNEVDKALFIHKVTIKKPDTGVAADEADHVKIVNSPVSLERKFYLEIKEAFRGANENDPDVVVTETLMGSVDLRSGIAKIKDFDGGKVVDIEMKGCFASTPHNESTEVGFEIKKQDFEIGTGRHFEVNLPMEFVNDMYAMYQIDSASTATETMSNVINQKLEQEIFDFIRSVQIRNPQYVGYFDAYPSGNYAINHADWATNIRRVIDFQCASLKHDSYFYNCTFSIVGNPLDTMLIPNVQWSFSGNSEQNSGVSVNYSIGAVCGANKYTIISSDLVPKGSLYIVTCPTVDDFMTIKYYPYTFNVVHNYLNANGKTTMPNIMMTKRHTFGEFMPLLARIDIANNDGRIGYTEAGANGGDTPNPWA